MPGRLQMLAMHREVNREVACPNRYRSAKGSYSPTPPNTRFLRDAKHRSCDLIDGLEMLVGQGAIGIHYWTGITPDTSVMRAAPEDIFGGAA